MSGASGRWLRLAVAIALLLYLLSISNPAEIGRAFAAARPWPILVAVLLTLADRALMAHRWLLLLAHVPAEGRPPLGAVMRIFFVSTFLGTFLPASVGGDLVRAYALSRHRVPLSTSTASVVMDRALGVLSILLVGAAAVFAAPDLAPAGVLEILVLGCAGCAALSLVIYNAGAADAAAALVRRLPWEAGRRMAARLLEAVRAYRHQHGAVTRVLLSSIAVQGLRVLQAFCLGRGLGLDVPIQVYFVTIPVILLIMLLPVTVNGLGTSQAAFIWCFGSLGVPRAEAFALSVLFLALGVVGNLPGGLLYATGGLSRPRPTT